MQALKRLPTRTFSILMSVEPAAAALCGWLFLHERLTPGQWVAVGLVVLASAGSTLTARTAVAAFALPPKKQGVKLIDAANAGELIKLLRNEAKVI